MKTGKQEIDFPSAIQKFDEILERGLCAGVGKPDGQMCIEAAISQALGLPFNDKPSCVAPAVRRYKIQINDSNRWKSPQSRAEALRDIGIAQIGSAGVVDDIEFAKKLAEKTIRRLIPALFREVLSRDKRAMAAADRCEREGSREAAREARDAAAYAYAADAAAYAYAAYAAAYAYADAAAAAAAYAYAAYADAAAAAAYAADAAYADAYPEKYLRLSISLALEVLRELKSPGCAWIEVKSS
jgi:hypothetical protein